MTEGFARVRAVIRHPDPLAVALLAVGAAGLARGLEVLAGGIRPTGVTPVSTTAALVLGLLGLWHLDEPASSLLGDRSRLRTALFVGGLGVLAVQVGAHLVQVATLVPAVGSPVVAIRGINPATGTGRYVWIYVAVGVAVAALAEELLFRGLALRGLERRLPFHRANAAQAGLFGLWHLAWPLALATGPLDPPVPLPVLAVGTVLVTGVVGASFGVLARSTDSLWTPVLAHALHNGVAVFVHVRTDGVDRASALAPALVVGYVLLAWVVWRRRG